ncbi:hypothetical protein HGRIS_008918 [Hohenbuehelia grisea]|uniref:F-box domain-containing protein n=1 Tax=Hohenbuehelia grisea TaxID=104357 RepID=A0ABR3IZX7_9AGAR
MVRLTSASSLAISSLVPKHTIPDELLLLIFEEASRSEEHKSRCSIETDVFLLATLSQVSRRWHRVAMTPSLWSIIRIRPNDTITPSICLARSHNSLLDIAVEYGYTSVPHPPRVEGQKASSLIAPLLPHIGRWRSLRVSARRTPLRHVIDDLKDAHAGRLEVLEFAQCETEFATVDIGPPLKVFSPNGLPSLRSIRLYGALPMEPASIGIPTTRSLHLVRALDHPLEWDRFYEQLTTASRVENLTISTGRACLSRDKPYPMIELPVVRSLQIDFLSFSHQSTIFEVLNLPDLERLRLSWITDWDVFLDSLCFSAFAVEARFHRVTRLTIRMIQGMPTFVDFRLFGSFPNLEVLYLDDIDDVEPFFAAIEGMWVNEATGESLVAWPMMREIHWVSGARNETDTDQIKALEKSRRISGHPLSIFRE